MNTLKPISPKKIVIFASGSGTNAENIIHYFENSELARVVAVFSNKPSAKVLVRAHNLKIKSLCFDRESFYKTNEVLNILKDINPDLIVLAGFLWLFPSKTLQAFPAKVINLHPALLPNFGGAGMYGDRVHSAVIDQKHQKTGITIHYVNEKYDEGQTIFQTSIPVAPNDTPTSLAEKIHELEYRHFPEIIKNLLENKAVD
ncbi:phosphoribosylglycinamide formyltransferase [Gillisia limnaea]|uniref:Phosphoribosylglycinamide formyltransferase n=1 Tax=Gillisia limnaea (strain DSM 15749 / LMG 21470 / R-8282) TaxID=865937 RepID=H2BTM5_GILLR|nr:phosphoribosylglycinamide formyltransferase [Gillisia limnaea]EHQ02645.1 formyltetrahydrofolate-dependent phosphoribosylglycinamide formyltransferase [Gillisia limnaea DSM 15749]